MHKWMNHIHFTPQIQDKEMAKFTKQAESQSFTAFFIKESIHKFNKPYKWSN